MDCINAEIDKELELIDLESTNSDHNYSDDEQVLDDSEFKLEKEKENKWLDLFLEKTSQQNQKYQELISDAQDVLDQVADNVKTASKSLDKDENVGYIKEMPQDTENLTTDETSNRIDDVITSKAHEVRDGDVIDCKISDDSGLDVVNLTTADELNNVTAFNTEEYLLHDEEFTSKVTNDCDDLLVQIKSIESDRVAREQSLNEAVQNELSLLRNLQLEQMKLKDARDRNAAVSIQRFYRGYMARKVYGTILADKISESRQKRSMERVRKIEMEMQRKREEQLKLGQIKKEKEEYLRRLEEEKLIKEKEQKAEEEKLRREKQKKDEQDRLKLAEEKREIEKEKLRIEEEVKAREEKSKRDKEAKEKKEKEEQRLKKEMEKKKEILLNELEANQIVENGLNKHTSESLDNALVVGSNNTAEDDEINSKLPEDISTTIDSQVQQHETVLKDDKNEATKLPCEKDSSKGARILSVKEPISLSTSTMGNAAVDLNSKASSGKENYEDLEKQENTKITLMEFLKETSDIDDPKEKYIEEQLPSLCIAFTELLGVNESGDNVDRSNTNQFKTTQKGLVNPSNKSLDLSTPPSDVESEISKTNLSKSLKDAKECTDSANKTDASEITPITTATHKSTNSSLHEVPQNIIDREKYIMECMRSWKAQCVLWRPASVINSQSERRQIPADSSLSGIPEEQLVRGTWPGHRETANKIGTRTRVLINSSHELRESKGWSLATLEACGNLTHLTLVGCGLKHMHGIHSCRNLRHLDISHNKISALSLAGMYRLQSLVAVDNRFTSTNGMRGCTGLLHCDLSHNNITRVAGMEDCINLLHLRLSHNQLIKLRGVESLRSLILLQLSTNHLSSLDGLQHSGLLRYLDVSSNNFTKLPFQQLSNLVLLDHLNLSANYISEIQTDIEASYVWLPCLTTLNLSGNKVSEENFDLSTLKTMPLLQCLDLSENLIPNVENINDKIKNLNITVNWFATEHRQKHPVFEIFKATKFTSSSQLICLRKVARYVSAYKRLLSDEKAEASTLLKLTGENQLIPDFISFHCDYLLKHCKMATEHRSWLENKEALQENLTQESSENFSLTNSTKYELPCDINYENVTGEGTKSLYHVKEKFDHKQVFAAVKIQALWRMYVAKQRYQTVLTKRTKATVTIQTLWRGYLVRTSVAKALAAFKNGASDDSSEEFEEVDISALQFDEHQYDHKWAYSRPLVPNIPSPVESRTELKSAQSDYEYERSASMLNRTPLPPIGTANSEGAGRYDMQNYDMTNQLSSRSSNSTSSKAKSDLANQWGIQNSETSDLLLRRQRRLKGKRSQLPGAEDKLRRFQQMKNKLPTFQTPSKKPCSRVDYFKAQESGFHKMNKTSDSDERRSQYTYQWLHSEVNFPIAPKPPVNPSPRNRILLPNIGTPPASKQDHMEILSVSSLSSSRHRSHHLLQDIVRRHPA